MFHKMMLITIVLILATPVWAQDSGSKPSERFGSCSEGDVVKTLGITLVAAQSKVYDDPDATLDDIQQFVQFGIGAFFSSCKQVIPTAVPTATESADSEYDPADVVYEYHAEAGINTFEVGIVANGDYRILVEHSARVSIVLLSNSAAGCKLPYVSMYWPSDYEYTLTSDGCSPEFWYTSTEEFIFRLINQ